MALSFVAGSSSWAFSAGTLAPTAPAGLETGDLAILTCSSKYADVVTATPAEWTRLGSVANSGKATGNDAGNTIIEVFYRVWQSGSSMPTLNPLPNVVSAAGVVAYRATSGVYDLAVQSYAVNDFAASNDSGDLPLDIAAGDILVCATAGNSDSLFPNATLYNGGALLSTTTAMSGQFTALGTDMYAATTKNHAVAASTSAVRVVVTASTFTAAAASTTFVIRVREPGGAPPPGSPVFSGWGIPI